MTADDAALLKAFEALDAAAAEAAIEAGADPARVVSFERPDPARFVDFLAGTRPDAAERAVSAVDEAGARAVLATCAPNALAAATRALAVRRIVNGIADACLRGGVDELERARTILGYSPPEAAFELAHFAVDSLNEAAYRLAGSTLFGWGREEEEAAAAPSSAAAVPVSAAAVSAAPGDIPA